MVDLYNLYMSTNGVFNQIGPSDVNERAYLESLIRADYENYEKCHPDKTLEDLKRRARFSKEDKGLLRDWMAIARQRGASNIAAKRLPDLYIAAE